MTIMFNTRQAVQKLRARGFEEPQADAITEVVEDATKELVTKADLREAVAELRIEMQKQRAEFYRVFAWLAGFMIAVAGVSLTIAAFVIG